MTTHHQHEVVVLTRGGLEFRIVAHRDHCWEDQLASIEDKDGAQVGMGIGGS